MLEKRKRISMSKTIDITASIVIYNEDKRILKNTILCFLNNAMFSVKLYLVDNTENSEYQDFADIPKLEYVPINQNIGFGRGHNQVIESIKNESKYHLILNPDVGFEPNIFKNLIEALNSDDEVSMIAPKVLFPDRTFQNSCRRFPKVSELIARRNIFLRPLFSRTIKKGKYEDKDLSKSFYAEYVTGCFQLYKTDDFVQLGGFDERYFLYMEDVDICRKIDKSGKKTLYYPQEQIIHVLKKGSNKSVRLFFIHFKSAMKYFNKWGY